MRQLKSVIKSNAPKGMVDLQERLERSSDQAGQLALLHALNREQGIHPIVGQPFTPELRKRITELVVVMIKTAAGLELMEPFTMESLGEDAVGRHREEIAQLNRAFSGVRLIPEVELALDGRALEIHESLYVDPQIKLSTLAKHGWKASGTNCTYLEAFAILGLISLVKSHSLGLLRRCDCVDWFIASRTDQKFCSSTCRQKNHASQPGFNKKRREYYQVAKRRSAKKRKAPGAGDAKAHR